MKYLLLIRHAKSSWDHTGISDFERPLNERGKKDAPEMAHRLLNKKIKPQLLVTSTAKRARKTCAAFAEVLGIEAGLIAATDQLYLAGPQGFKAVIASLPDDKDTVALFAHNPGITDFANELTHVRIDHMPTCSVFGVKAACMHWKDFELAEKEYWLFDWPKNPAARQN